MRKLLLLGTLCIATSSFATPFQGKMYDNMFIMGVSPDGRYVVSVVDEQTDILDLKENKVYTYSSATGTYYTPGHGNNFSQQGVMVGSDNSDIAGYWKDDVWKDLPMTVDGQCYANAITPDGSRIAGEMTPEELVEDGTMLVPCYWDVNSDGTISDPVVLPYPDVDYSGRAPQYITALYISNDGKRIVGQVRDYAGVICYPITYVQDANGSWNYILPGYELINPDNVVLPENPGNDYPVAPEAADYMDADKKAMYEEDFQDWVDGGYQGDAPDPADYMTSEQVAEYNAAVEAYNKEAEAFNEKITAYYEALDKIFATSPQFDFNNIAAAPDCLTFATTALLPDPDADPDAWFPEVLYQLYTFDVPAETYQKFDYNLNLSASQIMADGTILAHNQQVPAEAYILPAGKGDFMTLYNYYGQKEQQVASWMDENLRHTVDDYNTGGQIEAMATGYVRCSDDMSVMAGSGYNVWDQTASYYYTYILQGIPAVSDGVEETMTAGAAIRATSDGVLHLTGEFNSVEVYDLSGARVFRAETPAETVATGLARGIYVVKAAVADGTNLTLKVIF